MLTSLTQPSFFLNCPFSTNQIAGHLLDARNKEKTTYKLNFNLQNFQIKIFHSLNWTLDIH